MKKVVAMLRDYFGVSQQEARGLLVLLSLTALLLLLPLLYRSWAPDRVTDTTQADQRQLDSLVALLQTTERASPKWPEGHKAAPPYDASNTRKSERFNFDPNTIDAAGWQRLGLPSWLAERIGRYHAKGGQFRRKEDVLKIYDFPPDLYRELEPYMQLKTASTSGTHRFADHERWKNSPGSYAETGERGHYTPSTERVAKPALQPFDINGADTTDLIKLRGIGAKLAGRIIKFRDALGGFASTSQYAEIFGLDSLAREELGKYARIESPARKIAINMATAEELDKHVYLSKRQAEIIVNYRSQHGPFASLESLKPIRVLDSRTLEKLGPYLTFQ